MSKRLTANISWLALIKVTNTLLPLITLPYLTSRLGVELFGVIAIGMAIQQVVFSICDYGFGVFAPKIVAENSGDLKLFGQLISAITIIKIALFGIAFTVVLMVLNFIDVPAQYKDIWILMLLPALLQSLIPTWLFLGIERMVNVTITTICERVIYTVLIFTLINSQADAELIPMLMSASLASALLVSLVFVKRLKINMQLISMTFLLGLVKNGWGYFYSRLTMLLFSKFNVIIVGSVLGEASAGYYSLAERIYNAGRSLIAPLTDALYPHMVKTQNWPLAFKIVKVSSIVAIGSVVISYILSNWFFITVFGSEEYRHSAEIFNILMIAFAFSLISMLIGYPILGAMGKATQVNRSVLFGALVHLTVISCLWLLDCLSGKSLAASLVLTECTIFCLRMMTLYRSKIFLSPTKIPVKNGSCQ